MNRLPPESLSRIAQCFLDNNAVDTRSIIPLTHVCRYWRESIISTPGNWALISSEWTGLTELSLKRCMAAPLELWLHMPQVRTNPGFSTLVTPHLQNTKTLRVRHISSIEELAQILQNFPQSMPNLQSLSLSGHADWDRSIDPFESLTPALTQLSLISVPLYPSFMRLKALTDLTLRNHRFNPHLDTLLDFLEENRSLERVTLDIRFIEPPLRNPWRRITIGDKLRSLSICSTNAMASRALISSITLQRGAHLEIIVYDRSAESNVVLSVVSTTYFPNLRSPTQMEYHPDKKNIRLIGPNGSFSFKGISRSESPFTEFPLLHLTDVRTFRLVRRTSGAADPPTDPIEFPLSSIPSLETLAIEREVAMSRLFSTLFSSQSAYPSLKILAFLDCGLDDGFMEALKRFASNRKNTTSARLYRVVIVNSRGNLPKFASIESLEEHVPIVDVRIGRELPTDLI